MTVGQYFIIANQITRASTVQHFVLTVLKLSLHEDLHNVVPMRQAAFEMEEVEEDEEEEEEVVVVVVVVV